MVVRFMGLMGLAWAAGLVAGCDAAIEAESLELGLESRECGERRCSRDEACVAGYCEAPCEPHQLRCDGECVDRRLAAAAGPAAREFVFTGAAEAFVVPGCVAQITVELWGAQGGGSRCCDVDGGATQDDGGRGAYVRAELAVSPGEVLYVVVGGQGAVDGGAGFNGGGLGGAFAGGGGGASDLREGAALDERLLVAGGGGGGQCGCPDHGAGGLGGALIGGPGKSFMAEWAPGGGGTQSFGGAAGTSPGAIGAAGVGGGAAAYHVAGGGGGWFGGGSAYAAGGGGGSSYLGDDPEAHAVPGTRPGDGAVRISW